VKRKLFKSIIVSSILMVLFSVYIVLEYYPLLSAGRAYEKHDYDVAVKEYNSALFMYRDLGVLTYNIGVAMYRKGDYLKAAESFSKAAITGDRDLKQKAHYNLGNCIYRSGQQDEDIDEAARLYRKALDHYNRAIALNTRDEDAKYNKDLVERRLKGEINGLRKDDEEKLKDDDQQRKDNKQQQPPQPQDDAGDHRGAGNKGIDGKEMTDDPKGKVNEKAKAAGLIKYKKGEMSREDAEMLLEEYRKKEQSGSMPADRAKMGRYTRVEKDW
jgi:tetratricopeptide (TPR) repeat protein